MGCDVVCVCVSFTAHGSPTYSHASSSSDSVPCANSFPGRRGVQRRQGGSQQLHHHCQRRSHARAQQDRTHLRLSQVSLSIEIGRIVKRSLSDAENNLTLTTFLLEKKLSVRLKTNVPGCVCTDTFV